MNIKHKSLRDYVFGVDGDAGIEILELASQQAFENSGRKASREEFVSVVETYLENEVFYFDDSDGSSFDMYEKEEERFNDAVAELLSDLRNIALVDKLYAEYEEQYAQWEKELADAW